MANDEKFIKIKDGETLDENFNIKEKTVTKVYKQYKQLIENYEDNLKFCLENCESPIEQLLRLELETLNLTSTYKYNSFIDIIEIENQVEIKCGDNKYRVDFLIPVIYRNQENKCFIIECDGYEFHQKNKKQVENDNIRERNLQKEGYEVIRFSGSEIWNDSHACALEIKKIIFSKCKYIKDK